MNNKQIDQLLTMMDRAIDEIPDESRELTESMLTALTSGVVVKLLAEICKRLPEPKDAN